jgi:hypothetical protein
MVNQILALPLLEPGEKHKRPAPGFKTKNPSDFVQGVRRQIKKNKTLDGFFSTKVIADQEVDKKSVLMNPIVLGGLAVVIAAPLVLRYI